MSALPISIFRVDTPDGPQECVSCLTHDQVFAQGMPPEGIVGVLLRSLGPGETITPVVFSPNRAFADFLHGMIARRASALPGFIAEARRQGNGWIYVIDQRAPTPDDAVPPEDILGFFQVSDGEVVPDSYQPNPRHLILSANGFMRLEGELQACLLEELAGLATEP